MKLCRECGRPMPENHFTANHTKTVRHLVRKWGDASYSVEDHTPTERLHSDDLIEYLIQKQHRIILALEAEIDKRKNELASLKRTRLMLSTDVNSIVDQAHKSGHTFSWERKNK